MSLEIRTALIVLKRLLKTFLFSHY